MIARWRSRLARQRAVDRVLRYTATDAWALQQFCASMSTVRSSLPDVANIRIDMRYVHALDASTVAALRSMSALLSAAGIGLSFHDCGGGVERELERGGFPISRDEGEGAHR